MLMCVPELALRLMSVPSVGAESLIFIRFIGAFVFGVGFLYLFAVFPVVAAGRWAWLSGVLLTTAWMRGVVCLFTTVSIIGGDLSLAWWSVPVSDGLLALVQFWVLWKGWVPGDG